MCKHMMLTIFLCNDSWEFGLQSSRELIKIITLDILDNKNKKWNINCKELPYGKITSRTLSAISFSSAFLVFSYLTDVVKYLDDIHLPTFPLPLSQLPLLSTYFTFNSHYIKFNFFRCGSNVPSSQHLL